MLAFFLLQTDVAYVFHAHQIKVSSCFVNLHNMRISYIDIIHNILTSPHN